jgi:hypothetical protein
MSLRLLIIKELIKRRLFNSFNYFVDFNILKFYYKERIVCFIKRGKSKVLYK